MPGCTLGGCAGANPAAGTHRGLCPCMEDFSCLSHELQGPSGSTRALADQGSARLKCPEPGLLGAWLGAEQGLCLWAASPHLCVRPNHFGEPPWWFAWAGGLSGRVALVLQDMTLPRQDSLCQLPVPWDSSKTPEQLLYVNSLVFWQFCTLTSCLDRCSVKL